MKLVPAEMLKESSVHWNQPMVDIETHHGLHPAAVPSGAFSVAAGIRGDYAGAARKDIGFQLWADLNQDGRFIEQITKANNYATALDNRIFTGCWPFTIRQRAAEGFVSGFLLLQGHPATAAAQRMWIVYQIQGHHNPGSPSDPQISMVPLYDFENGAEERVDTAPVAVVSNGLWLYVFFDEDLVTTGVLGSAAAIDGTPNVTRTVDLSGDAPDLSAVTTRMVIRLIGTTEGDVEEDLYSILAVDDVLDTLRVRGLFAVDYANLAWEIFTRKGNQCLWFQGDEFVAGDAPNANSFCGWRRDYFGVPQVLLGGSMEDHWTHGLSYKFINYIYSGSLLTGGYVIRAKLYDEVRNRVTGLGQKDLLEAGGFPGGNSSRAFLNVELPNYYVQSQLWVASVFAGLTTGLNSEFWTKYQIWSTLSSLSVGKQPPDVLYFMDQMGVGEDWSGEAVDEAATRLTGVDSFLHTERVDQGNVGNIDLMPTSDSALAGTGVPHDFLLDEYRVNRKSVDAGDLSAPKAAIYAQGLTMILLHQEDEGPKLVWSSGRDVRPENISLSNEYDVDFRTTDSARFVSAADITLLFGDGPVYAIKRAGSYVDVIQLFSGLKLVNSWAATVVGNMVFAMCENGCWLIDAVSGNPVPVDALDRLVRDRWADRGLLADVSVAYDSRMDCLYILCPGAAECVALWFRRNKITMYSGFNYTWARELQTLDTADGGYISRAMFVSVWGKIVTAARIEDTTRADFTMHALGEGNWPDAPANFQARISTATVGVITSTGSSGNWDYTDLPLVDEDDNDYNFNPEMMQGVTIAFLDGDRIGEIHNCGWQDLAAEYGVDAQAAGGASPDVDLSADAPVDLSAVDSDCYLRVEGTVEGDVAEDLYSIVAVNDGTDVVTTGVAIAAAFTGKRWTIIIPGKTNVLRVWGTLADHVTLRGGWIAISPVPTTLIGAPLSVPSPRAWRHRLHVGLCSYVISDLSGADSDRLTLFPLFRMGVCTSAAIFATEPVVAPASGYHSAVEFVPGPGALSRWLDPADGSVTLVNVPETGVAPSEDKVGVNYGYLHKPYGTTGMMLYPILISDVAGVSFDLLELEFEGIITPTETDDSEDV